MNLVLKSLGFVLVLALSFALATVADGDRAYDRGDYEEAIAQYKAAYEQRSDNVEALYKLAKATTLLAGTKAGAEAESLYGEAASYARQAIELDPDEPETHMELARALGRLAQFKGILESLNLAGEVKSELEKALALKPDHGGALHALALWHLEVPWIAGGRSNQVKPLFEQSIAAEPDAITHYTDFGEALIRLNEKEAAREQLELAISLPVRNYGDEEAVAKAKELLKGL
ncbi:MAG: tetratricopeptide repeat protein [Trueperaceae bacterium]|nr:tetratricopeptide repeat protein [Trueperaceae bacterium]